MSRLRNALAFSPSSTKELKISIYRSWIRKSAASSLQHSFEFIRDRAKSIHGPARSNGRTGSVGTIVLVEEESNMAVRNFARRTVVFYFI